MMSSLVVLLTQLFWLWLVKNVVSEEDVSETSPFLNAKNINVEKKYSRWAKRNRIPYFIDTSYSPVESALIKSAINQVMADLNYWITFVPVPANSNEFKIKITPSRADGFTPEKVCYSFPGMLSIAPKLLTIGIREQRLVLARGSTGCMDGSMRSIMKYLTVVLGKRNEHQRGDRGQWINVQPGNWTSLGTSAYRAYTPRESNWQLFPYDYCSITHNQPEDYAVPGKTAFTVLKPPGFIPKLNRLSESDCRALLMLYSGDPSACVPLNCASLPRPVNFASATAVSIIRTLPPFTPPPVMHFPNVVSTFSTSTSKTSTAMTVASTLASTTTNASPTAIPDPITCPEVTCPVCVCVAQTCAPPVTPTIPTTTPTTSTTTSTTTSPPTTTTPTTTTPLATTTTSTTTTSSTSVTPSSTDTSTRTATRIFPLEKTTVPEPFEIDNNCPRKFCSGTVDHAALYLDGEQSVLFFDDCAQKIDNTYQLVGRPIPINEVIPSGAVSGPLQSVWTDMGAGQFRMHVLDSAGNQRICTIVGCESENPPPSRGSKSVFAIQNGDAEIFRTFILDGDGTVIIDEAAPGKPIHLKDIRGPAPIPALESISTAWMIFDVQHNKKLAVIGKDKTGKQYLAELSVDLSQQPAVFAYVSNPPLSPLFSKLHPCP